MPISSFAELEALLFQLMDNCLTDVRLQWVSEVVVQVRVIAGQTE